MTMHFGTLTRIAALATLLSTLSAAQDADMSGPISKRAGAAHFSPPSSPLVGGADDCPIPDPISGAGPHAFDNSAATTSTVSPPDGQSTTNCIFYGLIAIDRDVWFTWTSGVTGQVVLDTCGQSTVDTKIAVYTSAVGGPYCPGAGAIALACNDDIQGLVGPVNLRSRLSWNAVAGNEYVIQVGTYPGAAGGPGSFTINPYVVNTTCQWDDGTSENANAILANPAGSQRVTGWMMRNGSIGGLTSISTVSAAWGWTGTGSPLPAGLTGNVAVFEDPNDDGDPTDGELLATASAPLVGQHTNVYQAIPLGTTVTASGYFFIAAWVAHTNGFPAAFDGSGCGGDVGTGNQALGWLVGNQGATLNIPPVGPGMGGALASNSTPPFAANSTNGNLGTLYMLRADCGPAGPFDPSTLFCFGDGSGTPCTCAGGTPNPSAVGANEGCANSLTPGVGAKLRVSVPSSPIPSVTTDSNGSNLVTLQGSQMPNSSCLYFQGTIRQNAGNGVAFGDGLRCAGGSVIRLGTKTNASGASQYPTGSDFPISVKGGLTLLPGGSFPATRTYQAWYRNSALFCVATATFNLSNGAEIVWQQ